MEAIYIASFLKVKRGFIELHVDYLINFCFVIMIFATIFAGWLADRVDRRKIFVINIICVVISTPYLLGVFECADFTSVIFAQIAIALMAAIYIGAEPALQAELYVTSVRSTALSISYNTATSIFGGTAPYILESLFQKTGTIMSASYYIIPISILSLIALYYYRNNSLQDYQLDIENQ